MRLFALKELNLIYWARIILYILLGSGLPVSSVYATSIVGNNALNFIALSDIHFDPFFSCGKQSPCLLAKKLRALPVSRWSDELKNTSNSMSKYRQNTNYELLQSTLTESAKIANTSKSKFVLVLGDFLAHDFRRLYKRYTLDYSRAGYQSFVRKTLQFIALELQKSFPDVSVYSVVGNNDTYHYNYSSYPGGRFFSDTARTWSTLIKNSSQRRIMQQQFSQAGYYAVSLSSSLRLIVVNSVLFSEKVKNAKVKKAAQEELSWFSDQLAKAKARDQKVFIAMHIPSSVDLYPHVDYRFFRLLELWHHEDINTFENSLKLFSPELAAIFVGHLHRDWFQVMTLGDFHKVPVLGTPSVSPVYGNNPGFKLYTYQPGSSEVINFKTYQLVLNKNAGWQAALRDNRMGLKLCKMHDVSANHILSGRYLFRSAISSHQEASVEQLQWQAFYQCDLFSGHLRS